MKSYALVTGATSGIGLVFARRFASEGYPVVLSGRNEKNLHDLSQALEERFRVPVLYVAADLSLPGGAEQVYREVKRRGIEVEYLINNAGTQVYGIFTENDPDVERRMLEVNLVSLVELCRLFLPDMKARGSGRILNVGSTGSFAPGPFNALYCASKAFVLSFSEAVNEELLGSGITITTLCPGATRTNFALKAGMEHVRLFRMKQMSAEKVAHIGFKAMMQKKPIVIAGWMNRLQVFSIRLSPRWIVTKTSKALMS